MRERGADATTTEIGCMGAEDPPTATGRDPHTSVSQPGLAERRHQVGEECRVETEHEHQDDQRREQRELPGVDVRARYRPGGYPLHHALEPAERVDRGQDEAA